MLLSAKSRKSLGVSRETEERLSVYVDTLIKWNQRINLIGRTTVADVWERHIVDSAQLNAMAPDAQNWVDLGSGAGLPALIIAAMRVDNEPDFLMTAVEADQRKCAFIADVARKMDVPIKIINARVEDIAITGYDTVSARALAPLTKLLNYAMPLRADGAICLFPKGAKATQELTAAAKDWHMNCEKIQSVTDVGSVILKIKAFERVA